MNILRMTSLSIPAWRLAALFALLLAVLVFTPAPPVLEAQAAPDRPTGLAAQAGDYSVTLTWNDPGDSSITRYEYQVNHNDTSTGNLSGWTQWADIPNSDASTTDHTFTGVTKGKEYRYKIRAVSANGESKPAPGAAPWYVNATPTAPPPPPPVTEFWVERICDHHLRVRWKWVDGATGYDLNISKNHRQSWKRLITNKKAWGYKATHWSVNKTFWFAVRSVNAHGESAWTDVQSVAPPCVVEGLQASYAANGDMSVSWNPATRAEGYNVNFSADNGRSWQRMVSNHSGTSYTFNKDPQALPYNPNFIAAVQSQKGGMTSEWRNASIVRPVAPVLSATNVSTTSATLNIANHNSEWHYKANKGPDSACQSVAAGTSSDDLTGLSGETTYTYTAYSDSGCSSQLGEARWFVTRLSASNMNNTKNINAALCEASGNRKCAMGFDTGTSSGGYLLESATLKFAAKADTVFNRLGDIRVTLHAATAHPSGGGDNKIPASPALATLSGSNPDTAGDYTYTCSGAGCNLSPNTTYFIQADATAGTAQDEHYFWETTANQNETLLPGGNGWALLDELDYGPGGESWGTSSTHFGMLELEAKPYPALSESEVTATSATLNLSHYGGEWWLKRTDIADQACKSKGTTTTESLTNLTENVYYTYKAYRKEGCGNGHQIASTTFIITIVNTPSLTASNILTSSATLTIANHTAAWYYKSTTTGKTTCESVDANTASASVSGLTANTAYTFSAYSDSGCTTANLLATAAQFTTPVSVSNLGVTSDGNFFVGNYAGINDAWATGFSVPAGSSNYTLNSIIAKFGAKGGSPGSIAAKIYSNSGGKPGTEVANLTLTGPTSPVSTDAMYVCSGACELTAGNTYHLAFLVSGASTGNYYSWRRATSNDQTNTPATGSWTIADYSSRSTDGGTSWTALQSNSQSGLFWVMATVKP